MENRKYLGKNRLCPGKFSDYTGKDLKHRTCAFYKWQSQGATFSIETDEGNLHVILGPEWYISTQQVSFDLGVFVEVTGTRVTLQKEAALLAYKITVDNKSLNLRDESGVPLWSRRGRR